jgi:hypothetical protein
MASRAPWTTSTRPTSRSTRQHRPDALSLHNPVRAKGRKTVSNKEFYIYAIYVDGVVRYIGKGRNGRMHFHALKPDASIAGAHVGLTPTALVRNLQEVGRSHEAWRNHYRRDHARWPRTKGIGLRNKN